MAEANKLAILSARTGKSVDDLIDEALTRHNGNVAKAAERLGISRQGLSYRLALRQRETQPTAGK